mmetsp:Transcript_18601/g.33170  ORF Transcript_18601/g.33170 Transcript_18601/m.33170 type:complete len:238 (+) Transcript_18601:1179-1892(+)
MSGVCTYWKPLLVKNSCVAKARAERTRATALMVLLRGRRWAISRRNSKVWRFFCSGYVESQPPTNSTVAAFSSIVCFPPTEATISPDAMMEAPVAKAPSSSSSHPAVLSGFSTTCSPPKLLPSVTSINANCFWSRTVLHHPLISTLRPTAPSPASLSSRILVFLENGFSSRRMDSGSAELVDRSSTSEAVAAQVIARTGFRPIGRAKEAEAGGGATAMRAADLTWTAAMGAVPGRAR